MTITKIFPLYIFCFVLFLSCNKPQKSYIFSQKTPIPTRNLDETTRKDWSYKDIINDSIPGISLSRAYKEILKTKKGENIIIAVIDQSVDINHTDLQEYIWTNENEIPNNNIDDDQNGYIDDINGWNYNGSATVQNKRYSHYDYTRTVKAYQHLFESDTTITESNALKHQAYIRAKELLTKNLKSVPKDIQYANNVYTWKNMAKTKLSKYLDTISDNSKTLKKLDSLKKQYPNDSTLLQNINIFSGFVTNGYTDGHIEGLKLKSNNLLNKQLNIDFNEREITNDTPNDINNSHYGNNIVNSDLNLFSHGTIVSGVILRKTENLKVMPLTIVGYGSTHDKDIALAIRYAVDNGAKVINMSFGKSFSLYKNMVDDAIKYAEKHNVVIITSAGNNNHDMDRNSKFNYPDDRDSDKKEFVSNFIKVGGTSRNTNSKLKYTMSNYGSENVDLFAPAKDIYTSVPNNEYKYDSGTSLAAAITSKVAGILYSYYPKLTSKEVKLILMESGVSYSFKVNHPSRKKNEQQVTFSQLSKSGKILNAYNALIMADSISNANH
ncbi:Subtilase family protein [Tenacibaculum sp. MAR_2009_124]|uniref:S8 family serine peptidase n=1 Tax=Tenacibaculum sp. MAR_2009_124 TaxID=1250059 RepID=UPI00089A27DC|nr:S8 family serine peptidase [Tenacibaculum sp. MAR_2009_124]SEC01209.1 Subtilase family protein [Tenacibaculum sp. MAR_2009_124]